MLKYFKYLFVILTIVTLSSCSGDEDPAFGSISGRVYDYATHVPLAGVHVSLSPSTRFTHYRRIGQLRVLFTRCRLIHHRSQPQGLHTVFVTYNSQQR